MGKVLKFPDRGIKERILKREKHEHWLKVWKLEKGVEKLNKVRYEDAIKSGALVYLRSK